MLLMHFNYEPSPEHIDFGGCRLHGMNVLTVWEFLHMLVSVMCNSTYSFTDCMPH